MDGKDLSALIASPLVGVAVAGMTTVVQKAVNDTKTSLQRAAIICVGVGLAVFLVLKFLPSSGSGGGDLSLSGLRYTSNQVQVGSQATLTTELSAPAPEGGAEVFLWTNDPDDLLVEHSVVIQPGETTASFKVMVRSTPQVSPPTVFARYKDKKLQTWLNVVPGTLPPGVTARGKPDAGARPAPSLSAGPGRTPQTQAGSEAKKALSPELVSRLEEANGRLVSENAYWDGVKKNMDSGGSLRPEITSQLYAANSASKRCDQASQQQDAPTLGACIDALNDHLNQLKLQH